MKQFQSEQFFDLSSFKYKSLFENLKFVWDVLSKINVFLNEIKLGSIEGEVSENATLVNSELISVGKGSVVEPGAYIKGPCVIGENTTVRHGAYIRGNFVAGDHCVIGHATEVKNSVMLNHSKAPHFAYLGDSVLGNDVNLGAGTVCANLRLDNKPVVIHFEGERIETGLRKFGAIIGDYAQTGGHTVLNPGTLMGKKSFCYPSLNVGGYIIENQKVKRSCG